MVLRRALKENSDHPGKHVIVFGGAQEESDPNLQSTAFREFEEETGFSAKGKKLLGKLPVRFTQDNEGEVHLVLFKTPGDVKKFRELHTLINSKSHRDFDAAEFVKADELEQNLHKYSFVQPDMIKAIIRMGKKG